MRQYGWDRRAARPVFCGQFDGFRRRDSDHSPGSAQTVSGTIAQLGEPPPCKREMRVRVPLVSTIHIAEPKSHSGVRVSVRDQAIPNSSEGGLMCDYRLHATASRPAKIADKLVTTSFISSSTRGFAAVEEPGVAVCLLPGTEVGFDREAEYDHI